MSAAPAPLDQAAGLDPAKPDLAPGVNQAARARLATWRGGLYSLLDPRPGDININEMCEALAALPRFNAQARHTWSVAQHLILCARLAVAESADPAAAPYILLHDAHEAYIGDQTSPQQRAFDLALAQAHPGIGIVAFTAARRTLSDRWDDAIRTALRLPPPGPGIDAQVHAIDALALTLEAIVMFDRWSDLGVTPDQWAARGAQAHRLIGDIRNAWPAPDMVADSLARLIRQIV